MAGYATINYGTFAHPLYGTGRDMTRQRETTGTDVNFTWRKNCLFQPTCPKVAQSLDLSVDVTASTGNSPQDQHTRICAGQQRSNVQLLTRMIFPARSPSAISGQAPHTQTQSVHTTHETSTEEILVAELICWVPFELSVMSVARKLSGKRTRF